MDQNSSSLRQPRPSFRSVFLTMLGGLFLVPVVLLLTGGILPGMFLIGAVGLLHYALWGRALSQELADEREAEQWHQGGPMLEGDLVDTGIPADAGLLPSGEKRTEDGIQCGRFSNGPGGPDYRLRR